ncbi:MAG: dipeptidase [Acidobacteriota bacterium]|nr:dipeptidase [Acidobacteriota bacterium]
MSGKPVCLALLVSTALIAGCAQPPHDEVGEADAEEEVTMSRGQKLAQEMLIVDTHIDVPYRFEKEEEDISVRTEGGDFDYPRAHAGGLNVAFMSIYVPASYQDAGGAKEFGDGLLDMVEGFASKWPDKFAVARSTADVERHKAEGLISMPLGMENGAPIEGDLDNLRHFAERGIRYITLTHSKNNHICDSSYETEKKWGGLSPFGREVVSEMNRLGVMVDVSHVSDDAFYQVLEVTQVPVIASHSSCRHFTPGFERNMDDEMIQALAENDGALQINFGSAFLTEEANTKSKESWDAAGKFQEEQGLEDGDPKIHEFMMEYRKQNPMQLADVGIVADHIDHVRGLVGIDHVGLGSDFDGVGPTLPDGLKDVSEFPNLIDTLLERGYTEEDIAKVMGGNLMRVWRAVEAAAETSAG